MSRITNDKNWEKEIKKIIREKEKELTAVIGERESKQAEEKKIVNSIEAVVEARGRRIIDLIKSNEKLGIASAPVFELRPHGSSKSASGKEGLSTIKYKKDKYPHVYEYELVMPKLSDVLAVNLLFRIDIRRRVLEGNKFEMSLFLRAYHKYPDNQLDQKGFLEIPYGTPDRKKVDEFVKNSYGTFIESWYVRKIGEERDKEREYEVKIRVK